MSPRARDEPIAAARFTLTIDGADLVSFSELGGLVSGFDPSQLESTPAALKKLPGKRTPPTVILQRGMTKNIELSAWHEAALAGAARFRKKAVLTMFAADGSELARWNLESAWPAKLEIGALKDGAGEVLMETVTIVCERIQRISV
jgi:phage tail-like protein